MRTLLLFLVLSGCGSTTITASDYRRDCTIDLDCTPIYVGDLCDCSCPTAGINVADKAQANADLASFTCDSECGACQNVEAYCASGSCATRVVP